MPQINPQILQAGDSILYRPSDLIGVIIAVKTWSWTSHIEVYIGSGCSVAAREEGVNIYPLRNDKYVSGVLRPTLPVDMGAAMDWFNREAKGDKYSVSGLFGFFAPKETGDDAMNYKAEFCSMFAHLFYEHGGFFPFAQKWPAIKTAPAQFWQSPLFNQIFP